MSLIDKIFGSYSKKELARIEPIKQAVLDLDEEYSKLSEQELKGKTQIFKDRLAAGEDLDTILPEALATCREAAYRVLGKKPFPVQIIGAIVLHQGRIAEMKTGEGKTLVACLAAYLNALSGKGVHVVTVNDYLAKFQSEEMGKVYRYLGLSIGVILHGLNNTQRRAAYNCDITYITNNERIRFNSFFFLGPHSWHIEVPRLRVKSEQQLPAYTTGTATPDKPHL